MQYTTTISHKGQIVVPKEIRDHFNLKSSDRLNISVKDNMIVARPVISTDEVFGMFKTKNYISKKDIKTSFKKHITSKFS